MNQSPLRVRSLTCLHLVWYDWKTRLCGPEHLHVAHPRGLASSQHGSLGAVSPSSYTQLRSPRACRPGSSPETVLPCMTQPWKSHSVTSTVLQWYKQSQVSPDSRVRDTDPHLSSGDCKGHREAEDVGWTIIMFVSEKTLGHAVAIIVICTR